MSSQQLQQAVYEFQLEHRTSAGKILAGQARQPTLDHLHNRLDALLSDHSNTPEFHLFRGLLHVASTDYKQAIAQFKLAAGLPFPQRSLARKFIWIARAARRQVGALPTALIIGCHKAGSTTYGASLAAHPAARLAARHETHFFDRDQYYLCGLDWYRAYYSRTLNEDGLPSVPILFEKTPRYFYSDPARARINADLDPKTKISVILREPVGRAFSHFKRRIPVDYPDLLENPESAGEIFVQRLVRDQRAWTTPAARQGPHAGENLFGRGAYAEPLKKWMERPSGVHITQFETMTRDWDRFREDYCRFFGIANLGPAPATRNVNPQTRLHLSDAQKQAAARVFDEEMQSLFELTGVDYRR